MLEDADNRSTRPVRRGSPGTRHRRRTGVMRGRLASPHCRITTAVARSPTIAGGRRCRTRLHVGATAGDRRRGGGYGWPWPSGASRGLAWPRRRRSAGRLADQLVGARDRLKVEPTYREDSPKLGSRKAPCCRRSGRPHGLQNRATLPVRRRGGARGCLVRPWPGVASPMRVPVRAKRRCSLSPRLPCRRGGVPD